MFYKCVSVLFHSLHVGPNHVCKRNRNVLDAKNPAQILQKLAELHTRSTIDCGYVLDENVAQMFYRSTATKTFMQNFYFVCNHGRSHVTHCQLQNSGIQSFFLKYFVLMHSNARLRYPFK